MSLLNILSNNISGSVLGHSRALSSITSTTFGQAGTSLTSISNTCVNSAKAAMGVVGGSDNNFFSPISSMRDHAISVDPANTSSYNAAAQVAINNANANAAASLPGFTNSLYDTQVVARESVALGVNNFGSAVNTINPTISVETTNIGLSGLSASGTLTDTSCTAAYGSVNNTLTANIANINKTIADKAEASISKIDTNITPLPTDSSPSQTGTMQSYTSSGVDEGDGPKRDVNTTDVIYQDIKIYVEGVQVPFESASIGQSIGRLPHAVFQVPPQAGLMDIARYYQPKVHIFYTDNTIGGDRLLFWGHIIAVNYSRSQLSSSATISFECVHKNALLHQVTFEWSGGGAANPLLGSLVANTNEDQASVQVNMPNSQFTIMRSLQGITGLQSLPQDLISPDNKEVLSADPTLLPIRFQEFEKRLIGMPASIMNIWNQVKIGVYSNEKLNIIFGKMFVPLMEDGIKFFDRLSGHYFLESQIQNSKVEHCSDSPRPELSKYNTMLPPAFRMDIQSAVQTSLAVSTIKNSLNFSGEFTSFYDLFEKFYLGVEYELVTLASPSEIPVDPTIIVDPDKPSSWINMPKTAVETIIKPQIPFYFSPICNVLLPNMFHTINVTQHEDDIPTRITAVGTSSSQMMDNPNVLGVSYRAPESIRETIALGRQLLEGLSTQTYTLADTTGSSFNLPGKYELGRGIKHMKIALPNWLSNFVKDQDGNRAATEDQQYPIKDSLEYKNLLNLHHAWIAKYGYNSIVAADGTLTSIRNTSLDVLDPYSDKANIMAFERLLFSTADYEYTREVVKSKSGVVSCLFNPYIVPGYPMDILDASPNHPSFHAMCGSVTHSITSRSISTDVSFLAAVTYTEMSNYYLQPIHPWLRNALRMVNVARSEFITDESSTESDNLEVVSVTPDPLIAAATSTTAPKPTTSQSYGLAPDPVYDSNQGDVIGVKEGLIDNPRAKAVADMFYRGVFGVGSVDPSQVYDFVSGGSLPVSRSNGLWVAGSTAPNISALNGGEINDNLTGVGGLKLVSRPIEGKKSIEAKFNIKFIDMTPENYNDASITYQNTVVKPKSQLLEPGASMFLDYPEVSTIMDIKPIAAEVIDRPTRGGA